MKCLGCLKSQAFFAAGAQFQSRLYSRQCAKQLFKSYPSFIYHRRGLSINLTSRPFLENKLNLSHAVMSPAYLHHKRLFSMICSTGSSSLSASVLVAFSTLPRNSYKRTFSTSLKLWRKSHQSQNSKGKTTSALYFISAFIFMIGVSYAAVPLYRMFCQATGLGGDPKLGHKIEMVGTMEPIRERRINVYFNADHHAAMEWNFKPSQKEITVVPGETALAFYSALNPTDKPVVGIATYNVVPFQAGLYFNKIQCFCFEEQWLNPNEEVDMPVFFYIDPEYDNDPLLAKTDDIILSYTFFKAEEGQSLPLPGFMKANSIINLNERKE